MVSFPKVIVAMFSYSDRPFGSATCYVHGQLYCTHLLGESIMALVVLSHTKRTILL